VREKAIAPAWLAESLTAVDARPIRRTAFHGLSRNKVAFVGPVEGKGDVVRDRGHDTLLAVDAAA
jgi:hypothetical protein